MHPYKTHTCGALRKSDVGQNVRLSGWVHRKRDHGNLLFIDLRDHYGLTQCVINSDNNLFSTADSVSLESVVTITGQVVERTGETINANLKTGEIELSIKDFHIESMAAPLPLQVNGGDDYPEETRLKYRFLDLRREKTHQNIILRNKIISSLRQRMQSHGFMEFQTPILTASSPEGARDFLVPSRLHPGKFYALPQAPQQYKQMLMMSGFDRYFQIAPCFRDEDARADRSPGEFYQLDLEMSFVTQDEIFAVLESVVGGVFEEFSNGRTVSQAPFKRIPYHESMLHYGSDKPDLRNPIIIQDVTTIFEQSSFTVFKNLITGGHVVRAIPGPNASQQPRSFFDKLDNWAKSEGMAGLGYVSFKDGQAKGPISKFLSDEQVQALKEQTKTSENDTVFFVCQDKTQAPKLAGLVRKKLAEDLDLIKPNAFEFCWVCDYPMFEQDEETGKIDFSHNPFSMPQGGLAALSTQDPLTVKAYQYDIVCNGIELSSGAIRNHLPEVMEKAFEIAGYTKEELESQFGGMLRALRYGAPPHGGSAPGVDRMVMLLADEANIREVTAFPMTQSAEELLVGAPAVASEKHLKEIHIQIVKPKEKSHTKHR